MSGNGAPTSFWASTELGRPPFMYLPVDRRRCRSERLEEESVPACGLGGAFRPGARPVHCAARPPTTGRAQARPDPLEIRPPGAQNTWPWLGSSGASTERGLSERASELHTLELAYRRGVPTVWGCQVALLVWGMEAITRGRLVLPDGLAVFPTPPVCLLLLTRGTSSIQVMSCKKMEC